MPRKRKALAEKSSNVAPGETRNDEAPGGEVEDRFMAICKSIDQQVQARAAAIRAIRDAKISEFVTQLKLQEASFSDGQLDMPLEEFLGKYHPDKETVITESGMIELRNKESSEKVAEESEQLFVSSVPRKDDTSRGVSSTWTREARMQTRSMR